jgi:OOP family OmpA-OmpF porin
MKNQFSTRQAALTLACALAFGAFPLAAGAQAMDINEKSLLMDSQGQPVRSADGKCVHSAFGPQPAWNAACHDPLPVAQYVAPVAAPAAPVPAPVAAAPVAAEPVAAAPVAPVVVTENVTFDADVLFDSGKSELRPAGRESLDAFVGKYADLESKSIVAIGHADRMGSEASNQALSEARVSTVKSYLVSKGMSADRIQTSAVGETQPSAETVDCKDANNKANIACLQPDRRVMIEISGSRTAQ